MDMKMLLFAFIPLASCTMSSSSHEQARDTHGGMYAAYEPTALIKLLFNCTSDNGNMALPYIQELNLDGQHRPTPVLNNIELTSAPIFYLDNLPCKGTFRVPKKFRQFTSNGDSHNLLWVLLLKSASDCSAHVLSEYLANESHAPKLVLYIESTKIKTKSIAPRNQHVRNAPGVGYLLYGRERGDILRRYLAQPNASCFVNVSIKMTYGDGFINKTSVLFVSISFILLMIISMAWLVFYYIQRFRYMHAKERLSRRLANAAKKALTKIPVKTLKAGDKETECELETCAICIEFYSVSEMVRVLPCHHFFHKSCIDPWLLEQRSCPMCKLDILKAYGLQVRGLTGHRESQGSLLEVVHGDSGTLVDASPLEQDVTLSGTDGVVRVDAYDSSLINSIEDSSNLNLLDPPSHSNSDDGVVIQVTIEAPEIQCHSAPPFTCVAVVSDSDANKNRTGNADCVEVEYEESTDIEEAQSMPLVAIQTMSASSRSLKSFNAYE